MATERKAALVAPTLRELYEMLDAQVEAGVWWPAESQFEIVVGAVLTQNTVWTNVERAIANLSNAQALSAPAIISMDLEALGQLIRPSGYFRTKARYLQSAAAWYEDHGAPATGWPTVEIRKSLLTVRGIGEETADDILLYGYRRPVFIYDLYARRLFDAAGIGSFATYAQARRAVEPLVSRAGFSTDELAHFHGLIVDAGKLARAAGGWERAYSALAAGTFQRAAEGA